MEDLEGFPEKTCPVTCQKRWILFPLIFKSIPATTVVIATCQDIARARRQRWLHCKQCPHQWDATQQAELAPLTDSGKVIEWPGTASIQGHKRQRDGYTVSSESRQQTGPNVGLLCFSQRLALLSSILPPEVGSSSSRTTYALSVSLCKQSILHPKPDLKTL